MQKASAGAGLTLAEGLECFAKIVLGHRPIERRELLVNAVESLAIGLDGLLETFAIAFLNPQNSKYVAEAVTCLCPFEWRVFLSAFRERGAIGLGRLA
jgi:hypothetical protein